MNGTSRLASGWCRYPIGYGEPQNDQVKNHRQHLRGSEEASQEQEREYRAAASLPARAAGPFRDVTTKRRGLLRLLVEPRHLWRRYLLDNLLFLFRVLKQRVLPKMGRRAGTGADTLVRVMRGYTSCRSLRWSV